MSAPTGGPDELAGTTGWQAPPALQEALEAGRRAGFVGDAALGDQLAHSLGFAAVVARLRGDPPAVAADLGSGGGLPALVLVELWPECRFALVEAQERRAAFLRRCVETAGAADRVVVLQERAEVVGHDAAWRSTCDVVTARSFGKPAVTAECAAPLLRLGGLLVVSEPPTAGGGERWPTEGCARVGLEPLHTVRVDGRFGYQVLVQQQPSSERYPRRTGVPAKRPLF